MPWSCSCRVIPMNAEQLNTVASAVFEDLKRTRIIKRLNTLISGVQDQINSPSLKRRGTDCVEEGRHKSEMTTLGECARSILLSPHMRYASRQRQKACRNTSSEGRQPKLLSRP